MLKERAFYKAQARGLLWDDRTYFVLLMALCVLPVVLNLYEINMAVKMFMKTSAMVRQLQPGLQQKPGGISWPLRILWLLLGWILQYFTVKILYLKRSRGSITVPMLLDACSIPELLRFMWLSFNVGIRVLLWSLLLVVPGIVKSYSYSFAPYLFMEEPGKQAEEYIDISRHMMEGNKFDFFVLDLSFILWGILSMMTGGLLSLFVTPYRNVTYYLAYQDVQDMNREEQELTEG